MHSETDTASRGAARWRRCRRRLVKKSQPCNAKGEYNQLQRIAKTYGSRVRAGRTTKRFDGELGRSNGAMNWVEGELSPEREALEALPNFAMTSSRPHDGHRNEQPGLRHDHAPDQVQQSEVEKRVSPIVARIRRLTIIIKKILKNSIGAIGLRTCTCHSDCI